MFMTQVEFLEDHSFTYNKVQENLTKNTPLAILDLYLELGSTICHRIANQIIGIVKR